MTVAWSKRITIQAVQPKNNMEGGEATGEGTPQPQRHCAFCLQLKPFILCSGCHKRAYCSEQCRKQDLSPHGRGQGHENYCKFDCCEEDVDWEVKPVPGKGLGVVAKRRIPSMSRIIVEGIHFKPNSHPAIKELFPKGASLRKKFQVNCLDGCEYTQGRSYVALRISRVNHSCAPNAAHNYCESSKVQILYACRDIQEGEEICFAYIILTKLRPAVDFSGMSIASEFNAIRATMEKSWGFTCPSGCSCSDRTLMEKVSKLRILNKHFEHFCLFGRQNALQVADEILALQNQLGVSWIAKSNIHAEAAHVAMNNYFLYKEIALEHARIVYEVYSAVCPLSKETKTHKFNLATVLKLNEEFDSL